MRFESIAVSLVAVASVPACSTGEEITSPPAGDLDHMPTLAAEICEGCLVGPVRVERRTGAPVLERFSFDADPLATYIIDIRTGGSQGLQGTMTLNGQGLLSPSQASGAGQVHVRKGLSLDASNVLEVRLTGQPGTFLDFYILGGAAEVGPGGGVAVAPTTGASVKVSPGAFSTPVLVRISANSSASAEYMPLAVTGHDLTIRILDQGTSFGVEGKLDVFLPLTGSGHPPSVDVSALVREAPGERWWAKAEGLEGIARFSIPATGLEQMRTVFESNETQITLLPEKVLDLNVPDAGGASALQAASTTTCHTYPTAHAGWPAPGPFRQSPGSHPTSSTAIILVHGWDRQVKTCSDFSAIGQSGELVFARFLPVLEGAFRHTARVYVFNYPTFDSFEGHGEDLAARLADLSGVSRVVLIGHSMGGLVSRVAAEHLALHHGMPSLVSGIITLGTPHEGADLALLYGAFGWFTTAGLTSLVEGLNGKQVEYAPIFAHGGFLPFCMGGSSQSYWLSCRLLGGELIGLADNDGIVYRSSSVPGWLHRAGLVWGGYDHSEVRAGNGLSGTADDLLFQRVLSDVGELLLEPLLALRSGTPVIDGVIGGLEWAAAATYQVPIVVGGSGNTTATFYFMNDADNLYVALRLPSPTPGALKMRQVLLWLLFQEPGTGPFPGGLSDVMIYSKFHHTNPPSSTVIGPGAFDDWAYRQPCPLNPASSYCGTWDGRFGGTLDGGGTSQVTDSEYTIEMWHPLRSGDAENDFQLRSQDVIGLRGDLLIGGPDISSEAGMVRKVFPGQDSNLLMGLRVW